MAIIESFEAIEGDRGEFFVNVYARGDGGRLVRETVADRMTGRAADALAKALNRARKYLILGDFVGEEVRWVQLG